MVRCPLWFTSRNPQRAAACPLNPRKRTSEPAANMSTKGHKPTLAIEVAMSAMGPKAGMVEQVGH